MNSRFIIILVILISTAGNAQQLQFLDALFQYDISQINQVTLAHQNSDIERLQRDWGFSYGVNLTNSVQDEIDAGLSTRLYIKTDLLANGYFENITQSQIIENRIKIDSIQGVKRATDHNYGIYYNYVHYLYNKEKCMLIDSIVSESEYLQEYLEKLYYNKLINYDEILSTKNTKEQFSKLKEAHLSYNTMFNSIAQDSLLPTLNTTRDWKVDFSAISEAMEIDSSHDAVLLLERENLELQFNKENASSLSLTMGYDISRHRPFYGVRFNKRITPKKDKLFKSKAMILENDKRLDQIQAKKELLNLQYEYQYKEKQLLGLQTKLLSLEELGRQLRVKSEILSLDESKQEKKQQLLYLQIQYEILDLREQQMLLLLGIKRILAHIPIAPFIQILNHTSQRKKFAGTRFLLESTDLAISEIEKHFLEQNEITVISAEEFLLLKNLEVLKPEKYDTRSDMEKEIIQLLNAGSQNFVFDNIATLKALEIRTIQQKEYDLGITLK